MANSRAFAASFIGAVIGGLAGYLYFTERGRALRRQIGPALEEVEREINSVRSTVETATRVANEGWSILHEAMGDGDQREQRYRPDRSVSPF